MGATVGISNLIFTIFADYYILAQIGATSFLIQQCVIVFLLMCSKKMLQLCKERFSTTKVSPQ